MNEKIYSVCVIGGGAAGTMALLRTILNNDDCLFFSGAPKDKKKSRATWVRKIENMPAHFDFKRGIEDPNAQVISWIEQSAFKANFYYKKNKSVLKINKNDEGLFEITSNDQEKFKAQYVILCTGVMDVQPQIQGSISAVFDYANNQTIDYCLICDGHHVLGKKVVVLGHSNATAWVSIMLHERYHPLEMTILTNGMESEFQKDTLALLELYQIKIHTRPIVEIQGSDKGKVLSGFLLDNDTVIPADISFVSLGMIVYNQLATHLGAQVDERGFVVADENGHTTVDGLYVAGDLKANTRKQVYTAWDHAVAAASAINQRIRAKKRRKLLEG